MHNYSDLARVKQWCGSFSKVYSPKEIADYAAAFALLAAPKQLDASRAIVFGAIDEAIGDELRMQYDKLLLICSHKNVPDNYYIYDAVLKLPFAGKIGLELWLAKLARQA